MYMDFEDMLLDAMKQGKSLEDVMKSISDAATKIEKDRAAATKYDKYNGPVGQSYTNATEAADTLVYNHRVDVHDAAVFLAHFMCQNVPGYSGALAKEDTDPVQLYQKMLESQIRAAKVITEHQDDSDEEKGKAMFGHMLDEVLGSVIDKLAKEPNPVFNSRPCSLSASVRPGSPLFPTSDVEKMAKFFKDMGLD